MRVDDSPISLREIEERGARTEPGERELRLLFGVSFAAMWATIFLSTGQPVWILAVASAIGVRNIVPGFY